MAAMKYFVPVLAAAGSAAAASCSVSATTTIQNSGDATGLASCRTFTGSIAIATGASGQLAIDGVQKITENLVASNVSQLTSLSADSLSSIGGAFDLEEVQILSTLNFPRLEEVGSINWNALPQLNGLMFSTGVQMAKTVEIQNTGLSTLDGINLQEVSSMLIANNRGLNDITMQLGSIGEAFTLSANGRNVSAAFPNLMWAFNMTINNASSLSIPSLESINGSFGMNFNYFESVRAPNLTSVGGSLSFVSNPDLTNISFPLLENVDGGLQVANNTALEKVDGFPALTDVGGAIDCYGNFSDVSFNKLDNVEGAFNIQSMQNLGDVCNHFQGLKDDKGVIQGEYTCEGEKDDPSSVGTLSDGTSDGGSSTSSGAANAVVISGATGLLGVVAAMFGML